MNDTDGPEWVACAKRVRALFAGEIIADSKRTCLLREAGRVPVYFFPQQDVCMRALAPQRRGERRHARYGAMTFWSIVVGDNRAENAALAYPESGRDTPDMRGYIAFDWNAMERWYEEDEEVFVHAHDPFKRIDVLLSSRHVRIEIGGQVVAESRRPLLLFETGLPVRYYIPKLDVCLERLLDSAQSSRCPYKGEARYYAVNLGGGNMDIAWYYPFPLNAVSAIANRVCFFQERVDAFYVDGEAVAKPRTPWSL